MKFDGDVTVRSATIKLLRSLGINTIFGNPGSTELPMFKEFPEDFRYVLGLQESVVLGMADGFAQATRNAALVNLHSSAGLGHALGNLFTAYRNQTPLVVTAGQQARSILPFEPFLYAPSATEFPKPFVKWAIEPARAEDVPAAILRAYHIAMQRPQGPTFVSIPVDDWDRSGSHLEIRRVGTGLHGDHATLDATAKALSGASRPAFVVGAGIARDDAWAEMIELAQRHRAHVWVAPMSARNSFPEQHPLFAGFLAASREKIVRDLANYDLILVVGGALSVYHTEGTGPHVPPGANVYQLVDNPMVASWAPVGTSTVVDAKAGLQFLLDHATAPEREEPTRRASKPPLNGGLVSDAYLLQQIAKLRPPGSIIVEEAPSSREPMHDRLPILDPDSFYTCASGGLGHGLPAAIGIALGRPGEKVIAILGDGSAMYAIQGLWSAARLELPITFIIINNGRYQALEEFGRHFGLERTPGTALSGIDFCALATGQGVASRRATRPADIDTALAESFNASKPSLVEVMVS